jgi:hypothetical protein
VRLHRTLIMTFPYSSQAPTAGYARISQNISRIFLLTGLPRFGKSMKNSFNNHVLSGSRDKFMKRIVGIALSVAFLVACHSFGKDAPKVNPFMKTLAAVPYVELPAKATGLVLQTKPLARQAVTIDVVKAAVRINPVSAPAIVGAIARAVPEMASVAAGVAASEQPKQAAAIAKAAAAAAPSKAGPVVLAVCQAVPSAYRDIAAAVSQVVPGAAREILDAVASALPNLKLPIEQALAGYAGNVPSVADTLSLAANTLQSSTISGTASSDMARGPTVGPPYIPLTTTPVTVTPGTSGQVPTGGRNYAAP